MANSENKFRSNLDAALLGLTLDRAASRPLHQQLTEALRSLVLTGSYNGQCLPASRTLANELGVSRITVTSAFEQLNSEGYLVARQGAGTYIAEHLPQLETPPPRLERAVARPLAFQPFLAGVPDQADFPHRIWARELDRAWRKPEAGLLGQADAFGWLPLRSAIAEHLAAWRGLECHPEQVVITGGAWDGFDFLRGAGVLQGERIAMEDPGWPTLHSWIERSGMQAVPLRIDAEGFDPHAIPRGVGCAIVTPSRHYPTGIAMPLARRLALLHWAEAEGGLIIEDDYDSEFRYQGQPLPSLAGLDGLRRVVYMGSFSKLLSPSLRIGYLVLPEPCLSAVRDYLSVTGSRASLLPQPALAAFMDSGEFATHLRRMRRLYARRQQLLLRELIPVSDLIQVQPDAAGMHLCLPMQNALNASDQQVVTEAKGAGLVLGALSAHAKLPEPPQALLVGYAAFTATQLSEATKRLIYVLRGLAS